MEKITRKEIIEIYKDTWLYQNLLERKKRYLDDAANVQYLQVKERLEKNLKRAFTIIVVRLEDFFFRTLKAQIPYQKDYQKDLGKLFSLPFEGTNKDLIEFGRLPVPTTIEESNRLMENPIVKRLMGSYFFLEGDRNFYEYLTRCKNPPQDLLEASNLFNIMIGYVHDSGDAIISEVCEDATEEGLSEAFALFEGLSEDRDPKDSSSPRGYWTESKDWQIKATKKLLLLADSLDSKGMYKEANELDDIMKNYN